MDFGVSLGVGEWENGVGSKERKNGRDDE